MEDNKVNKVIDTVSKPEPLLPREPSGRPQRSNYFLCILYPREDFDHRKILDYLQSGRNDVSCCWIEHDRDLNEDGELKKPHTHVLIRFANRTTLKGANKYFAGQLDGNLRSCESPEGSLRYFTHDTYEAYAQNKALYRFDELHLASWGYTLLGDQTQALPLLQILACLNRNSNLSDTVEDILTDGSVDSVQIMTTLRQYQGLISTISNQKRRLK